MNQVQWLCSEIPKHEWSGILLYKVVGNFHTGNFYCQAKDLFPMNVGSSVYTEYEFNSDFIKYRMENPDSLDWEVSHCHSHNSMATFFSGTDMEELHDNAPNHNYYLSLIVNNALETSAKIAFVGKQKRKEQSEQSFFGDNGRVYTFKSNKNIEEDVLFIYDCEVELAKDIKVSDLFKEQTESIIQEKIKVEAEAKLKQQTSFTNRSSIRSYNDYNGYGDWSSTPNKRQMTIPYSEFENDNSFSSYQEDSAVELTEEIIEKVLIASLEQNLKSKSDDLEEVIFKCFNDYKVKGEKFITEFGLFFRAHVPTFFKKDELEQEDVIKIIESLYFYGEDVNDEFVEQLSMEILG